MSRAFTAILACAVFFLGMGTAKQIGPQNVTGFCLTVGDDPGNGTAVVIDTCGNGGHDDWDIHDDDGSIRMGADLCLDITKADFANGTQVELFQCLKNDAQQWKFDGSL